MKIVISGGGTGGHVYPAIAIADAIKVLEPTTEILFVGAKTKLEMTAVPKAGYDIIGLNIGGFQRKFSVYNVALVFRLIDSLWKSFKLLRSFRPDAVLGVGGYASGPVLRVAAWMKIPIYIQEQNSYAGITNKLISSHAKKIFVAFENMDKFFSTSKLMLLGNPVRSSLSNTINKREAYSFFNLDSNKRTIVVLGGSLGARTLNREIANSYNLLSGLNDVQLLWQTGKMYWDEYKSHPVSNLPHVKALPFIENMDWLYAISDVAITRAGAITISELAVTGIPAILVPSPNVAEDHQTKNALALVRQEASLMISDNEVEGKLLKVALDLLNNESLRHKMKINLAKISKPNAAKDIAMEILKNSKV
ncbi:MAG: undecaprenyldiphospho-muramoylpentapeptide beta-N-acetylglucosaminyltransferase [Saprospiraceae bacterium]|nr:undecaprenyldiphospho-muramoylpentapeptide beta-N-acetylglucosaminyltransferase [Saprospiraceae bacterium]